MLGKPAGGFKPIGIFTGLYRAWMKSRRQLAAQWELSHDAPFFAMAKHKRVTDPVWRQAIRQEGAVDNGLAAAVLLWDLIKFYETLDYERLVRMAEQTGFPMALLRICIAAYSSQRKLSMMGMASVALWAIRGVVAGCGAATSLVKLVCLVDLQDYVSSHIGVHLDVFVDDDQLA